MILCMEDEQNKAHFQGAEFKKAINDAFDCHIDISNEGVESEESDDSEE